MIRQCGSSAAKYIVGGFNARLGCRRPGEENLIGLHTFGREACRKVDVPNRDLLLEFCLGAELVVANTRFDVAPEEKITFMEAGTKPMMPVSADRFALLDLVVCDEVRLQDLRALRSIREAALATDHFLVRFEISCDEVPQEQHHGGRRMPCRDALNDLNYKHIFIDTFLEHTRTSDQSTTTLEEM